MITKDACMNEINSIRESTNLITPIKTNVDTLMINYMAIKNNNDRLKETVQSLTNRIIQLEEKVNQP